MSNEIIGMGKGYHKRALLIIVEILWEYLLFQLGFLVQNTQCFVITQSFIV